MPLGEQEGGLIAIAVGARAACLVEYAVVGNALQAAALEAFADSAVHFVPQKRPYIGADGHARIVACHHRAVGGDEDRAGLGERVAGEHVAHGVGQQVILCGVPRLKLLQTLPRRIGDAAERIRALAKGFQLQA